MCPSAVTHLEREAEPLWQREIFDVVMSPQAPKEREPRIENLMASA